MRVKPVASGLTGAALAIVFLVTTLTTAAVPFRTVQADDSQPYHSLRAMVGVCVSRYLAMSNENDPSFLRVLDRYAAYNGVTRDVALAAVRQTALEEEERFGSNSALPRSKWVDDYVRGCAQHLGIPAPGDSTPDVYDPRLDPMIKSANRQQYCAWAWLHVGGSEDSQFVSLTDTAAQAQGLTTAQVRTYARQRVDFLNEMINSNEMTFDVIEQRLQECETDGTLSGAASLIAQAEARRSPVQQATTTGGALDNVPAYSDRGNGDPYAGMTCLQAVHAIGDVLREDRERYDNGPAPESSECLSGGFDDSCYTRRSDEGIANLQAYCRAIRQQLTYDTVSNRCSGMADYLREEILPPLHCDRWAPQ